MATQHAHDDQLFKKLGAGGEMIFAQIYFRYYDCLAARSLQILASEALAKEAVMDTFLTLWINREEVAAMAKPVAWLYKCAIQSR